MTLARPLIERRQHRASALSRAIGAPDRDAIAARRQIDAEPVLDQRQMLVMFPKQGSEQTVVVEGEGQEVAVFGVAPGLGGGEVLHAHAWVQRAWAPSIVG